MRKPLGAEVKGSKTVTEALGISEKRKTEVLKNLDEKVESSKDDQFNVISSIWNDNSLTDEEAAFCLFAIYHEEGKIAVSHMMAGVEEES